MNFYSYNVVVIFMRYYLVGIKGSGMSALANVLYDDGNYVSGMDTEENLFTEDTLKKKKIYIDEMTSRNFSNYDLIIIGHQFMNSDIFSYIKENNYPYMEYHAFLEKYIQNSFSLAVSGSHGKTTTVGMLYQALHSQEKVAMLRGDGVGYGGKHNLFIFEACEYQKHFLIYHPSTIIITNIDYDHVDTYPTIKEYEKAFNDYCQNSQEIIVNYDDSFKIKHHHKITYGLTNKADYACISYKMNEKGMEGVINARGQEIPFCLPLYGLHNLMHILAVAAYLNEHHYDINRGLKELVNFTGVKRRMTQTIINDDVFIDDYAHHPKEIEASISMSRVMYPSRKVIVFFKPDRYNRLIHFQDDFKKALFKADHSFVLPLYEHVEGCRDSRILTDEQKITFYVDENDLDKYLFDDQKYVFVYMSSKKMKNWMESIVRKRENKS